MVEVKGYTNLLVWQKSMDLLSVVYGLARRLPPEERFGMADQMRRAAVSVPSNIAEGQGRNSPGEFVQFLGIARGSLAEIDTLMHAAVRVGHLHESETRQAADDIIEIRRMLYGLARKFKGFKRQSA